VYFFTHTIILKMFLVLLQVLWLIYVASRNEQIVNRMVGAEPIYNHLDAVIMDKQNNTINVFGKYPVIIE